MILTLTMDPQVWTPTWVSLGSVQGLPLSLRYHYAHAEPPLSGDVATLPVSLTTVSLGGVVVTAAGQLRNDSADAATVKYVLDASSHAHALNPFITLGSTQGAPLPSAVTAPVSVPVEALQRSMFDPTTNLDGAFVRMNGTNAVDVVTVTCDLAVLDDVLKEQLISADVTVTYLAGDGPDVKKHALGAATLRAAGFPNSSEVFTVLRTQMGHRTVTVSGTARYSGGSQRTIGPITQTDNLDVHITPTHVH
jgi:hypothetical protein